MATLAMWLQETYTFSSGNAKLLMIFIGLVAVSMVVQALVVVVMAARTSGLVKGLNTSVEELKVKLLPLIDTATHLTRSSQSLLDATAPKVKAIGDNLAKASDMMVETSEVVRTSALRFEQTIADANFRTQRQVARVDGMVTAALATTTEIVETIGNGIRVPTQKIIGIATQLRYGLEGLYAKVKSRTPGNGGV
jgi:hypothetical protein